MTPRRFETWLHGAIETAVDIEQEDGCHRLGIKDVADFVQAGVLTTNRGLVVRCDDGSEFQVTIVLSRCGGDDEDDD